MTRMWYVGISRGLGLALFLRSALGVVSSSLGALAADNPSQLTYQARLLNAAGTGALLDSNVTVRFQIYNPAGTCLLYEEQHTSIDTNATQGLVSLNVGAGTPTGANPGLSMRTIFANGGTEIRASGSAGCAPGFTPAGGDSRRLRVTVTPNAGTPMTLSPDKTLASVPYAWSAETVQGLTPSNLIQATGNTSQSTVGLLTNENGGAADDASSLHHHDSLYARLNSNASQNLGSGGIATTGAASVGSVAIGSQGTLGLGSFTTTEQTTLVGTLGAAQAGRTWYNSTTNQVMVWNGATAEAVATGSASQWTTGAGGIISYIGGNVGIGTASPATLLNIGSGTPTTAASGIQFGTDAAANLYRISAGQIRTDGSFSATGGMTVGTNMMFGVGSAGGYVPSDGGSNGILRHATNVRVNIDSNNDETTAFFSVNRDTTGTGGTELMRIQENGNVGVGVAAPAARLDVAGEAKVGNSGVACSAATQGAMRYNTGSSCIQACNGVDWQCLVANPACDGTPNFFDFNDQSGLTASALTTSNIFLITGTDPGCTVSVSISGGAAEYRVCSDSTCSGVVQNWTPSNSLIDVNSRFLQVRATAAATPSTATDVTINIGTASSLWQITTQSTGPCGNVGPGDEGTICSDGSIYAGISPDGNRNMYVPRCDIGMTWDGTTCTGTRSNLAFSTGNTIYNGYGNMNTGAYNTEELASLSNADGPYSAASACQDLVAHGKSDWYLPARWELREIYVKLVDGTPMDSLPNPLVPGFATSDTYWASTEGNTLTAMGTNFAIGMHASYSKGGLFRVRCARKD